jgi:hypothetical protein
MATMVENSSKIWLVNGGQGGEVLFICWLFDIWIL